MSKQSKIITISTRLLIFIAISLALTMILFAITSFFQKRFLVSWFSFECGVIGGFVSIQQRIKKLSDEDLTLLSHSWATIMVVPIYGGIFSLVLYLLFLSEILKGPLFPGFYIPPKADIPTIEYFKKFFEETYPLSGQDFAKLAFWSFVAGFSERFVPNIIKQVIPQKIPQ